MSFLFRYNSIYLCAWTGMYEPYRRIRHPMIKVTEMASIHRNTVAVRFHRNANIEVRPFLYRTSTKALLNAPALKLVRVPHDQSFPWPNANV